MSSWTAVATAIVSGIEDGHSLFFVRLQDTMAGEVIRQEFEKSLLNSDIFMRRLTFFGDGR
jgi:hypothetical protein